MRAKRAGQFFKLNCRERSERKIFGTFCTFPPNSSKLRSDYLLSFQKRTNYLFPAFPRSEYLFPKSASPHLRIKWSSPNIRKSEVIAFVVNAGMNVTANNFLYLNIRKKFLCLKCLLYLTEVLLDKYRQYISQIQGYRWWIYIVKISRGIIKHVYEVMTFGFVKVRHKVPLITI